MNLTADRMRVLIKTEVVFVLLDNIRVVSHYSALMSHPITFKTENEDPIYFFLPVVFPQNICI